MGDRLINTQARQETLELFGEKRTEPMSSKQTVRIEFDGGTSCNIPRLGYGIGYGSYRINEDKVVRVNHARPMSANVAEIWTLIVALRDTSNRFDPWRTKLEIIGDSQIALARCTHGFKKIKAGRSRSQDFIKSCATLRAETGKFFSFTTLWQPRKFSVATFGH